MQAPGMDLGGVRGQRHQRQHRQAAPRYEDMLADIESGAIGAVVAWHLDRLRRRPIELENFIALADAKGIALATVTGDVDLGTDQGRLDARITGAAGEGRG